MDKNLLVIILLFSSGLCLGQELQVNIKWFSNVDGLPGRQINDIQQDDRGFIWVATNNGLSVYDGKSFKLVSSADDHLTFGDIVNIKKDHFGRLWVTILNKPPIILNPTNHTTQHFSGEEFGDSQLLRLILIDTASNRFFFREKSGQIYYTESDEQLTKVHGLTLSMQDRLFPGLDNTIIVQREKPIRLEKINLEGKVLEHVTPPDHLPDLYESHSNHLFVWDLIGDYKLHELIYAVDKGMNVSPILSDDNSLPLSHDGIDRTIGHKIIVTRDSRGWTWMVFDEQLWLLDAGGNFLMDFTEDLHKSIGRSLPSMSLLFVDKQDNLWIGTGFGLILVNTRTNPFQHYLTGLKNPSTRGILEMSDGRLLVSTYSGFHVVDVLTEESTLVSKYTPLAIERVGNDKIICGVHGNGIITFDEGNLSGLSRVQTDAFRRGNIPFYDRINDKIYVGTDQGLFLFSQEDNLLKPYTSLNEFESIRTADIFCFHDNSEGIWIGSNQGLYLLNHNLGMEAQRNFIFNDIKDIHEDDLGDFWLATRGGGLLHWNRSTDVVEQYTTGDGLSDDILYAVYEDDKEHLWLPSNHGLIQFDKKSKEIFVFYEEDGITHNEFNTFSHYQATNGRLYFGGLKGITSFYPSHVAISENNAPFHVTQYQKFDGKKGTLVDNSFAFDANVGIVLEPRDNFFTIEFSLLEYFTDNHIYAWKIEGLDQDWNYQKENKIRFNTMPYGHYNLRIKAKGSGGNWAKNELHIPITVLRPFYKTEIFYLACAIAIALSVFLFFKWRILRLKENQIRLEKEVNLRTQIIKQQNQALSQLNADKDHFFSIIGHDLRGPLVSLRGLSKKVNFLIKKNRIEEVYALGEKVERAADGVTKLLDNLLSWALLQKGQFPHHPEKFDLRGLVNEIIDLYSSVAEVQQLDLVSDIDKEIPIYADKNALNTILRNLVDNALKFTNSPGTIRLGANRSNGQVSIHISDTGNGMNDEQIETLFEFGRTRENGRQAKKGTGLGLVLCKELTEKNKGSIDVKSQPGKGTEFTLTFAS